MFLQQGCSGKPKDEELEPQGLDSVFEVEELLQCKALMPVLGSRTDSEMDPSRHLTRECLLEADKSPFTQFKINI